MIVISFDLETTGIDTSNDRIVSFSFVKYDFSTGQVLGSYKSLVNPCIPIPNGASEIHGIYDKDVLNAPKFFEVAGKINEFIENHPLLGFNSNRFDIPLLCKEMWRNEFDIKMEGRLKLDALQLEIILNKRDLHSVYARYTGKNLLDNHEAEADSMATIEILQAMVNRSTLVMDAEELHMYSNHNSGPTLDIFGWLKRDAAGTLIWNIGKHKDKSVFTDLKYLSWWRSLQLKDAENLIALEYSKLNNK